MRSRSASSHLKRHLIGVFAMMTAFCGSPASAEDVRLDEVTVVAGEFAPFIFKQNGRAEGIVINKVRKILSRLNISPEIAVHPWPRAYSIAQSRPNTLIFVMARTPEREDQFKWVGKISDFNVKLFKRKVREDIQLTGIGSLKPYRVGGLIKDVKTSYLEERGIEIYPYDAEIQGIKMLAHNRIDLMPADQLSFRYRVRKLGMDPEQFTIALSLPDLSRPLYMAFNRLTPPEVVTAFREALIEEISQRRDKGSEPAEQFSMSPGETPLLTSPDTALNR